MKKVLYIEDEPSIGRIVQDTLAHHGYDVVLVSDGAKVIQAARDFKPDICVLDIMLPNIDGLTLCRLIKQLYPFMPVIFLTAKTETADLLLGFEAGGTDYIRKPFTLEELLIRIKNQFNLMQGKCNDEGINKPLNLGKYQYFPGRFEIVGPAGCVKLSGREQQVLSFLISHLNHVVDRKQLLLSVWEDDSFFNSRTLDVYVRKLRKIFAQDPDIEILTLKGKGYLFLVKGMESYPGDEAPRIEN